MENQGPKSRTIDGVEVRRVERAELGNYYAEIQRATEQVVVSIGRIGGKVSERLSLPCGATDIGWHLTEVEARKRAVARLRELSPFAK